MASQAYETGPFPFVVSAPSGTGKTTILRRLIELDPGLEHVVSTTTRPPRAAESDGKDYYFVDEATFAEMINQEAFVEWAEVFGDRYGTTKVAIDGVMKRGIIPVMDLDVQGAARMRRVYPGCVTVFIAPPSLESLRQRLRERRTESEEDLDVRLRTAAEEMKHIPEYDYLVINENLDETVRTVGSIITAEKRRLSRIKVKDLKK